jgi:hypothetical protein
MHCILFNRILCDLIIDSARFPIASSTQAVFILRSRLMYQFSPREPLLYPEDYGNSFFRIISTFLLKSTSRQ